MSFAGARSVPGSPSITTRPPLGQCLREALEVLRRERLRAGIGGPPDLLQGPRAGSSVPGAASSSERAIDLRLCANAARTILASRSAGAGPVRRSSSSADPTRGRGTKTAGSTVRNRVTSQASCTITLADPYSLVPGSARRRSGDLALDHHHPPLDGGQL